MPLQSSAISMATASEKFFFEHQEEAPEYFLLSAVYAYLYILADMREPPPSSFDQRFRTACDLYNFSLWRALSTGKGGRLDLQEGPRKLPVGGIAIALKLPQFPWGLEEFEEFLPSYKYAVRGITVRNRTRGWGFPS